MCEQEEECCLCSDSEKDDQDEQGETDVEGGEVQLILGEDGSREAEEEGQGLVFFVGLNILRVVVVVVVELSWNEGGDEG